MKKGLLLLCLFINSVVDAQKNELLQKVQAKLNLVDDYVAEGTLRTNISFIKTSLGKVNIYFKKPNKLWIKKEGGISLLPKGGVSLSITNILQTTNITCIPLGTETLAGRVLEKLKLIPNDEQSDWVIATLWIDTKAALVYKIATTTKEQGSYELAFSYGPYAAYGLASQLIFSFQTKDYKLPKGITMEFDEENSKVLKNKNTTKKGSIEINYQSYIINKGMANKYFK